MAVREWQGDDSRPLPAVPSGDERKSSAPGVPAGTLDPHRMSEKLQSFRRVPLHFRRTLAPLQRR